MLKAKSGDGYKVMEFSLDVLSYVVGKEMYAGTMTLSYTSVELL